MLAVYSTYPTHFWKWQAGLPDLSESEQTVMEIAKDLCVFFHQESVMVTTVPVRVVFVRVMMAAGFRILKLKMFPSTDMIPAMFLVFPVSWFWSAFILPLVS